MFKVTMQPDTVGNRLQEVQNAVDDLAKFGMLITFSTLLEALARV